MANLGSMGLGDIPKPAYWPRHLSGPDIVQKQPALPTPTSPKLPAPAGRSEGWSPTATPGSAAPGALAPKTDTAALPGMTTPYKGYEIAPAPGGGWLVLGKIPGAPFGITGPLNAFPAGTSMEAMTAWIDRRIASVKPATTPGAATAAKQESLPAVTQAAKADVPGVVPTTDTGATAPGVVPGAVPAAGMKTGTKVAIGAGGLLALLVLRR
jgi:hypothetical protein